MSLSKSRSPDHSLAQVRRRLEEALYDPELLAASRGLVSRVRLASDDDAFDVVFQDAGPPSLGPESGEPEVIITAAPHAWRKILSPRPPVGFHAFSAIQLVNRQVAVEGAPLKIAQARASLERLFDLLREPAAPPAAPGAKRDLTQIRGGYVAIEIEGRQQTLYVERAGGGPPVLLLHTAGADARQYHGLLSDVDLCARFSLFAFDMPFHGRTPLPEGWDGGDARLSQAGYLACVSAFIEQVVKEPVVLVGCSMGAAIGLVTAAERPDLLRGLIALQTPLCARGKRNPYLTHAAVAGGSHNSAFVRALTSPVSPAECRRFAGWIYAQGGPGVHEGDMRFYADEFDGRQVAPRIDAERTPIRLLTGEYDYSASPADGRTLEGLMPGSHFTEMPGLGHFPMIEHPDHFRGYFVEALDAVCRGA